MKGSGPFSIAVPAEPAAGSGRRTEVVLEKGVCHGRSTRTTPRATLGCERVLGRRHRRAGVLRYALVAMTPEGDPRYLSVGRDLADSDGTSCYLIHQVVPREG